MGRQDALVANLLQTVNTMGGLGAVHNMEAATRPRLLDATGATLAALLRGTAPVRQPSTTYLGDELGEQTNSARWVETTAQRAGKRSRNKVHPPSVIYAMFRRQSWQTFRQCVFPFGPR